MQQEAPAGRRSGRRRTSRPAGTRVGAGASVSLAPRRSRFHTAVLALGSGLLVGLFGLDLLDGPVLLQVLVFCAVAGAVLVVALRVQDEAGTRPALLLLAAASLALAALRLERDTDSAAVRVAAVATLACLAVAGGLALASATRRRAAVRRRLGATLAGQERERARLARELHDGPLQELAGVRMLLASVCDAPEADVRAAAGEAVELLGAQVTGLRLLINDLRPAALDELGLAAALRGLADRTEAASDLYVHADLELPPDRLDPRVEETVYRVVQESLTNVVKHAQAVNAVVRLRPDGGTGLLVQVEDDGAGIARGARGPAGLGLLGMRERADLVDGRIAVTSGASGTRIELAVPAAAAHVPGQAAAPPPGSQPG